MGLFSRRAGSKSVSTNTSTSSHKSSLNGASQYNKMVPQIPDVPLPKPPDPWQDPAAYLRSIHSVRDRARLVLEKAKRNQLKHFEVDMDKFPETASYVVSIIKVRFYLSEDRLIWWWWIVY